MSVVRRSGVLSVALARGRHANAMDRFTSGGLQGAFELDDCKCHLLEPAWAKVGDRDNLPSWSTAGS